MVAKKSKKQDTNGQSGVIYARYSSHAQRDCSIEQQVEQCTAHAKRLGIEIKQIYSDRAISGKTDQRPAFQKMLKDAEKGGFRYVIAWKSNRIGRNMLQAMVNEERLSEMGVRCLYVEEDFDDNAAGRFALRNMMNVNQFYIENMAEDIRRGLRDSAQQCRALGFPPLGYKKGPDGKFAIDEPNAEIVREIFRRVLAGEAQIDIINDLNRRGLKTSRGFAWSRNSLQNLLKNDKYIGYYRYMDIEIKGGIPRILTDELFYQVQEVMRMKPNPVKNRRRNAYGEYLLTGKLFCGKCGAPMVGKSGTGKMGKLYFYYTCKNREDTKSCDKENVRRDEIEDYVANAIKEYALTDDVIDWIADGIVAWSEKTEREAGLNIIESQIEDNQKALSNMMKAIEMGIISETTQARLQELEKDKRELSAKLITAKAEIITVTKPEMIAGLRVFRDGDFKNQDFRRSLFDTFLKAVYIYDNDIRIVFSFAGDKNTVTIPMKEIAEDMPDSQAGTAGEVDVYRGEGFAQSPVKSIQFTLCEHRPYLFRRQRYFVLVMPHYRFVR